MSLPSLPKSTKRFDNHLDKHPKLLLMFFWTFIILACLGVPGSIIYSNVSKNDKQNQPTDSPTEAKNEKTSNVPETLGVENCVLEGWGKIKPIDWLGMSWFDVADNVWSPKSLQGVEKDAAIYYKQNCTGGLLAEYKVTPRLENFLNLNIYERGQFRWEIGGNDRRSIRLWKNIVGCSTGEIKKAVQINLPLNYLPNHDEILINQPLIIHSALFYLVNGLIRAELWLTYASKNKSGEIITTPRGTYFYDFEVNSLCDSKHLPDINKESLQVGIGLQQLSSGVLKNDPILPKVSFEEFRIRAFTYSD